MSIGTLLLGLALFIIVAMVIALPMFDRHRLAMQPPTQRESLEAERDDIVRTIRELDFDHRTHKINDDDYKRLREEHLQRGAIVLRNLSTLNEKSTDADIEQRVKALRKIADADTSVVTTTCPSCGHVLHQHDKFCPQCGHAIRHSREGGNPETTKA